MTLVSGEAGIGKSRLMREAERGARAAGALVLRGECIELGDGEFPYAPLVGALRDTWEGPLVPALDRLGPAGRAELGRLVPTLAPAPPAGSSTQGHLFELLLALLGHAGEDAPVLLVIEDAHWADTSSRDFLGFLARNLGSERLTVAVSYRSDAIRREHPLRRLLSELIRCDAVEVLALERLDAGGVERLLAGILGRLPPVSLVREIHARSGGNPFFAEELLASPGADGEPPESLRDALLVRLEALPPEGLALARALAVLGRPAGAELLEPLSGLDEGRLSGALRSGLEAHLLVRHSPGEFEFRHALLREALLSDLSDLQPRERCRLHRLTAEVLHRERAGTGAELAFHWDAAGDHEAALPALVEAGLQAERLHASADALRHFKRALKLMETLDHAPDTGLDRVEVLRHTAEAARLTGDSPGAVELCRQALALLDERADPLRAACLRERLGEYLLWDDEAALACYSAALELLPASEPAQRARILGAQALKLHFLQRWPEARDVAQEALETAERAGARCEEGYARNVLGVVLAFMGDVEAGEAHVREAWRIAEETGGAEDVARVYVHLAEVLRIRGRTAEALEIMLGGEATATRLGMAGSFGRVMGVMAADDQLKLGRWADAEARLVQTARLELRASSRLLHAALWARLAVLRGEPAATERVAAARALCDSGTPPEYLTDVYHCAAERALWQGFPDEGRREVAGAFHAIGESEDPLYTPVLYWLGIRAEADAAAFARPYGGDADVAAAERAAAGLLERLEALIARSSLRAPPPEAEAHLLTCRAEAARLAGAPAAEAWAAASAAWRALGQPYPLAYACWREAEAAMHKHANRGRAQAALAHAHAAASELGAKPLLREIDALRRAARLDVRGDGEPVPAPPARAHADLGLTRRELEVLELVAVGLTNRAISQKLFISEKLTSSHVTRILAKLDARNRTDAAGIALRLGIGDSSDAPR